MCVRPLPPPDPEWLEMARTAARNLGFSDLTALPDEHWQRVLASVETRMRMKGAIPPPGWRERLAGQVGRRSGA